MWGGFSFSIEAADGSLIRSESRLVTTLSWVLTEGVHSGLLSPSEKKLQFNDGALTWPTSERFTQALWLARHIYYEPILHNAQSYNATMYCA